MEIHEKKLGIASCIVGHVSVELHKEMEYSWVSSMGVN